MKHLTVKKQLEIVELWVKYLKETDFTKPSAHESAHALYDAVLHTQNYMGELSKSLDKVKEYCASIFEAPLLPHKFENPIK